MTRTTATIQTTGDDPVPPLDWPAFQVVTVHEEYYTAKAHDGTSAYGDTVNIAKTPEHRESLTDGSSFGAVDDIITAAPLLSIVAADGGGSVTCAYLQVSGGPPAGGELYMVYSVLTANRRVGFDWVRAHA